MAGPYRHKVAMKILIVEADPNRQRQLRTILTSLGHKSADIESVNDAKSAITSLRKKRVDCCFVAMSSQVDAIALIKDIRGGASSKATPVIVFSMDVTKENVVSSAEAGASSFLAYPFSVSDVESSMKQAFARTGAAKTAGA